MAQEHKAKIEKQIEGWGYFEHLVRTEEFEKLLRQAMMDLVETDRHENPEKLNAGDLVDRFVANSKNKSASYVRLKQAYIQAINHWTKALEADTRFLRVNRRFNIQSIVTRLFTTLAIGLAVMIVYWLSTELGIQMPLQKIPMPDPTDAYRAG
ncbi:hypothetical protein ACO1PK_00675 [Alishewanella sp. d11]|uniref:hypothetical protein n=1 Tax=Alishewanella sp. d11 TaxID=3414030 RepID=UPI003BF86CC5